MRILWIIIVLSFVLSAFGAESEKINCKAKYKTKDTDHSLSLQFIKVGEAFELAIKDKTKSGQVQDWRVELENRFFFSRVEYYSYDPIRVRVLFNSTGFAQKGLFTTYSLNDGKMIPIKCSLPKKKVRK